MILRVRVRELHGVCRGLQQRNCHTFRRINRTTVTLFLSATHHPETGEKLNPIFTMAAFVPANVPICAGMILSAPTVFNTVLWQVKSEPKMCTECCMQAASSGIQSRRPACTAATPQLPLACCLRFACGCRSENV